MKQGVQAGKLDKRIRFERPSEAVDRIFGGKIDEAPQDLRLLRCF